MEPLKRSLLHFSLGELRSTFPRSKGHEMSSNLGPWDSGKPRTGARGKAIRERIGKVVCQKEKGGLRRGVSKRFPNFGKDKVGRPLNRTIYR